jgi:hypothetical protein
MIAYLIAIATCCLDIAGAALLHEYILSLLLCWYLVMLTKPTVMVSRFVIANRIEPSVNLLVTILVLLSLEHFMIWGYCFLDLIYLIPLTGVGLYLQQRMHTFILIPSALLCVGLCVYIFGIEWYILDKEPTRYYTIMKLGINSSLIIIMSLIVYRQGRLGNRF